MAEPTSKHPKRRRSRLRNMLAIIVLMLVGFVVAYRFVPPLPTWLMISRAVAGDGLDYRWRGLSDISPHLVTSVIAAEDATFCAHRGFDMKAIENALKANEKGGRIRGGSTISQQTAKNVFLWPSRDWVRKGLEAGYTVVIEAVWGKRRIMEMYLNVAEFAPGVYGAEAAARRLFGKSARDLTPREAARLAAVLPSPRRYRAGSPGPYVRRYSGTIQARARVVRNQGLADCVLV